MTRQVSQGTIHGHDLTITIEGPEAQDLPDDGGVGSGVLMARVEAQLAVLKQRVENE